MNALTILAALLVVGCGALAEQVPALDSAAVAAQQYGGCVKLRCDFPPLQHCRPAVGRCERN